MPRSIKPRTTTFNPNVYYYKPQGVPLRQLEEVVVNKDELEAIKLYELDNLSQTDSSVKMGISQPTFARILDKAQRKIAKAIINGYAIRIEK